MGSHGVPTDRLSRLVQLVIRKCEDTLKKRERKYAEIELVQVVRISNIVELTFCKKKEESG